MTNHTCTNTACTSDGSTPPPCPACAANFAATGDRYREPATPSATDVDAYCLSTARAFAAGVIGGPDVPGHVRRLAKLLADSYREGWEDAEEHMGQEMHPDVRELRGCLWQRVVRPEGHGMRCSICLSFWTAVSGGERHAEDCILGKTMTALRTEQGKTSAVHGQAVGTRPDTGTAVADSARASARPVSGPDADEQPGRAPSRADVTGSLPGEPIDRAAGARVLTPSDAPHTCPACGGSGRVVAYSELFGNEGTARCRACEGEGKVMYIPAPAQPPAKEKPETFSVGQNVVCGARVISVIPSEPDAIEVQFGDVEHMSPARAWVPVVDVTSYETIAQRHMADGKTAHDVAGKVSDLLVAQAWLDDDSPVKPEELAKLLTETREFERRRMADRKDCRSAIAQATETSWDAAIDRCIAELGEMNREDARRLAERIQNLRTPRSSLDAAKDKP